MMHEKLVRLFMKRQGMLREFILCRVPGPDDADDILQEVTVVVMAKSEVPREPEKLPSGSRGVARNVVEVIP
jgi:hypothetical protein